MLEPKSPKSPLAMASPVKLLLEERVYKSVNDVHPGMRIDRDAVEHILELVERVLHEILNSKPMNVTEMERKAQSLFMPSQAQWISKEAGDGIQKWMGSRSHRGFSPKSIQLHGRLVAMIKDYLGIREKEKKEREKEFERMALFLLTVADFITEDVIKWTGVYVKKLRDAEMTITLQNVKISLSADTSLMQLNELLNKNDEESAATMMGMVFDFDLNEPMSPKATDGASVQLSRKHNYADVSSQFLSDERQYLRDLNLLVNVFRRKFEAILQADDKERLDVIFSNVTELHELTIKMERTLEDAREMSDQHCVGTGVWELAEGHEFDVYMQFIQHMAKTNLSEAIALVLSEKKYAKEFEAEARAFTGSSSASSSFALAVKYVLPSLILSPLVHFVKYVEYCTRLHSFSQSDEDRMDLSNCRSYLSGIAMRIEKICASNAAMQKRLKQEQLARQQAESYSGSQFDRILEMERRIDGYVGEPIARTCRELVKEGDLTMVRPSITLVTQETLRMRRWTTERRVCVFDHLLVLCKQHKNGYKFKDRLSIRTVEVHDLEDTEVLQNAFKIEGKERQGRGNDNFRNFSYTFICKSSEEKEAWMESVVSIQSRSMLDRMLDGYLKEERKRIPLMIPDSLQYIFAEPDTDENIVFEDYTSSSGIPVVKNGTLVKLVERLTYHLYTDNAYVKTFLISYRSFCTPTRLLQLLVQRFEVPVPAMLQQRNSGDMRGGPLAGRYDTVQSHGLSSSNVFNSVFTEQSFQRFRKEYEAPIQLKVLNVMRKWVLDHYYDFEADSELLQALTAFLHKLATAPRISNQHRKFAQNITSVMKKKENQSAGGGGSSNNGSAQPSVECHFNFAFDNDGEEETLYERERRLRGVNSFQPKKPEPVWHTAKKGELTTYDLLTLHPLELGRQLTLIHFDLYRAIKPIELVGAAWMKADKYQRSPQLLKLTHHSTQLTYWVSRSIVETESLEERVAIFARVLEVMSVFEELHNFTGLVAFYSALNKACVHRLTWCWDRLDNEKQKSYDRFKLLCNPHWDEMVKRLQSINPPCVPFFGHYLTSIVFYEGGNSTFVNMPGNDMKHDLIGDDPTGNAQKRLLVSFQKCRRIANVISEIQMYQNEPYILQVEPTIRQFFESINPRNEFGDDGEAFETYLYEKSLKIQPKDVEKPAAPDSKPKHNAATLKSPGIKPPRQSNHHGGERSAGLSFASSFGSSAFSTLTHGNSYTRGNSGGGKETKTAPPTPGYDTGDPKSADGTLARSHGKDRQHQQHHEEHVPFHLGDVVSGSLKAARQHRSSADSKTLPPQSRIASSSTAPSSSIGNGTSPSSCTSPAGVPPPLPSRRPSAKSPSLMRSLPTPSACSVTPSSSASATAAPPTSLLLPTSSAPPPPLHPRKAHSASVSAGTASASHSPNKPLGSPPTGSGGGAPQQQQTPATAPVISPSEAAFVFPTPSVGTPSTSSAASSAAFVAPPAIPPRRPAALPPPSLQQQQQQVLQQSGATTGVNGAGEAGGAEMAGLELSPTTAMSPVATVTQPSTSTAASPTVAAHGGRAEAQSLKVTLDGRAWPAPESVSPTVSLSMPVPPALPPRRREQPAPPPLPPKSSMHTSTYSPAPPPLPPKTYKRRKQSSSPTDHHPPAALL